jgi:hypothetical protein
MAKSKELTNCRIEELTKLFRKWRAPWQFFYFAIRQSLSFAAVLAGAAVLGAALLAGACAAGGRRDMGAAVLAGTDWPFSALPLAFNPSHVFPPLRSNRQHLTLAAQARKHAARHRRTRTLPTPKDTALHNHAPAQPPGSQISTGRLLRGGRNLHVEVL